MAMLRLSYLAYCLLLSLLASSAFSLPTNVRSNDYFLSTGSDDDSDASTLRKDHVTQAIPVDIPQKLPSMALHAIRVPMNPNKMTVLVGMLLVLMLVFVVCIFMMQESEESEVPQPPQESKDVPVVSDLPPAKTYADLFAIRFGEGSWVQNYRMAQGMRKEALEFLFRCQIIPEEEFATAQVSQALIDEGVETAQVMLQEKTLEEWCSNWMLAVRTFQEAQLCVRRDHPKSVADRPGKPMERSLASHISPRSISGSSGGFSKRSLTQGSDSQSFRGKASSSSAKGAGAVVASPEVTPEASSGRFYTDSQTFKSEPKKRPETGSLPARFTSDRPATSQALTGAVGGKNSSGQSQLLARCREIMAKTDQTRVSRSTTPPTSKPSSVVNLPPTASAASASEPEPNPPAPDEAPRDNDF